MAIESYWIRSTESTQYPTLSGDLEIDVAVVGGGIAGIATAWELARAGRSVAVVEADRLVAGITGHTTAKLTAQHNLIYAKLRDSFGPEAARLYASSQQDALAHVAAVIDELGINCDLERRAAYTYVEESAPPSQVDQLRAEAEAAADAGLPAEFVRRTGLPFAVGGAVRVADQAQFHPRKYLLALAADLTRRAGKIYERTRVVKLDVGSPCRLSTEHGGTITAGQVVIATNFPIFNRASLLARLVLRRELVLAAPIDAAADPDGMYITTADNTRSVRTAPFRGGRRLLIVTGETFRPGTAGVTDRFERLAGWTRQRFDVTEFAYRWAAQDVSTPDHVPFVGQFPEGKNTVYVATGFGGWGMTNAIMASRLLTALMHEGHAPAWARLYDPHRLHPLLEVPAIARAQAAVARHFIGDRLKPSGVDRVAHLAPGSGAVLHVEGERCAVYRDVDGTLNAVSANCTHMGCVVGFNDAETSWDCPCHGSRFRVDGSILNGPATKPLPRRDIHPKRDR
ncbi:MAG TPA: FAD-dependent oxidoreductase [Micromonosporaceae bacterium]